MDPGRVKTSLNHIKKIYSKILDGSCPHVIAAAVSMVDQTKERYDYAVRNRSRGLTPEPWGYAIYHDQPLRFKRTKIPNGLDLQVDVYCDIRWEDADVPVQQDLKIRIWSEDARTVFDENRDASVMQGLIEGNRRNGQPGRVVSRFHFDKSNPGQSVGPVYHLQFGGIPEDYELCWHPKKVNVPRLVYHPVELCLTCQMIAMNFFPDDYLELREKIELRQEVLHYQEIMLKSYYQQCLIFINDKELLLESLWSS